ncbi:hypothetical protein [Streptomyces litchfieldiae]|uniref:Integral membrane protein n=1 Tax=Streptomyces litchfieldiae TaxID=3075543 RepID=A0ABU2MY20_9ACTN|nr:hypothetical protein [Streptomyces sp. DSM 44938]MDT0346420.1 hypothetical protein [Streptomyces sp. DSM 44938]
MRSLPGDVAVIRPVTGRVVVGLLRTVCLLALITTIGLAAVAGLFVTGDIEMLDWHETYAMALNVLTLAQVVLAVLLWRRNRWLRWPMAAALGLLVMVAIQQILGDRRTLGGHMPLGMAICAVEAALVLWTFALLRPARTPDAAADEPAEERALVGAEGEE